LIEFVLRLNLRINMRQYIVNLEEEVF